MLRLTLSKDIGLKISVASTRSLLSNSSFVIVKYFLNRQDSVYDCHEELVLHSPVFLSILFISPWGLASSYDIELFDLNVNAMQSSNLTYGATKVQGYAEGLGLSKTQICICLICFQP